MEATAPLSLLDALYGIVTLFLIPAIIYLYRENTTLRDKRLQDLRDMLAQSNDAFKVVEASFNMQQESTKDFQRLSESFLAFRQTVLHNHTTMLKILEDK